MSQFVGHALCQAVNLVTIRGSLCVCETVSGLDGSPTPIYILPCMLQYDVHNKKVWSCYTLSCEGLHWHSVRCEWHGLRTLILQFRWPIREITIAAILVMKCLAQVFVIT